MIRRVLIFAQACGGPLFGALLLLNIIGIVRLHLNEVFGPNPLPKLTAWTYSHSGFVVTPLVACGLVNAFILFRAWRKSGGDLAASQLETNACLASGLITLAWVFGMLVVSFMPFMVTIKAVTPDAM